MSDPLLNEPYFSMPVSPGLPIWMNDSIQLTSSQNEKDIARFGQNNQVVFSYFTSSSYTPSVDTGIDTIKIDWWVSNPTLNMYPPSPVSHKYNRKMETVFPGAPVAGKTTTANPETWHPPQGGGLIDPFSHYDPNEPNDPENPAVDHKCIIAVCYPYPSFSPAGDNFYVGSDPHYAQHNIHVLPANTGSSGGAGGANFSFKITTTNPDAQNAERTTLRVVRHLNPNAAVRAFLQPRLQQINNFRSISNRILPQGFSLELPDFPNAVVRDRSKVGCLGFLLYILAFLLGLVGGKLSIPEPTYEADIQLQPHQFTAFNFKTDLSSGARGDAYVYHLSHIGADNSVRGGSTLVLVGQ